MRRLLIVILIAAALGLHASIVESADASSVWDANAASYNFDTTSGAMMGSTFAQNYSGGNFNADFAAILDAVAQAMSTSIPPLGGSEVLSTSLQNWPDP
ncbi:MAG: hypothetical protein M3R04_10930 [bacterium]|nr:hypothetical protein [bacterium]